MLQISKALSIGVAGPKPYVYIEDDKFKGSDIEMIKILRKKIGFSYNLKKETYPNVFWMVVDIYKRPRLLSLSL